LILLTIDYLHASSHFVLCWLTFLPPWQAVIYRWLLPVLLVTKSGS